MTNEQMTAKLIALYAKAQQNLIEVIAKQQVRGSVTTYQRNLLAQINKQLVLLSKSAIKWTKTVIPKEYQQAAILAAKMLKEAGSEYNYYTFSRLHTQQIELLVKNISQDFIEANSFVGRQLQDIIRQSGIEAATQKVTEGQTVKQMQKILTTKLIDGGITGVPDKRGRLMKLDRYAELVSRSTTRESQNKGLLNQLTSSGYDLVKMSSHATTCPVCEVMQGRVYSISGKDSRFPPLRKAFAGGHANIHPRCRHVLTPYIERFQDDVQGDINKSNRSFDIEDSHSEQFDRYNTDQKRKTQLRNDRDQWERYKLALPDDTPTTLAGFRRMKSSNSERYQELQSDYRSLRASTVDS